MRRVILNAWRADILLHHHVWSGCWAWSKQLRLHLVFGIYLWTRTKSFFLLVDTVKLSRVILKSPIAITLGPSLQIFIGHAQKKSVLNRLP